MLVRPLDILIVDDEPNIRRTLTLHFESRGHRCAAAGSLAGARKAAGRDFDLALVDLRLGNDSGLDLIAELASRDPSPAVVVITAYASLDSAIQAMKLGARDYLKKPFQPADLDLVIERLVKLDQLERRYDALAEELARKDPEVSFETDNPTLREALGVAWKVAPRDTPILIQGASGTGKGVLARAVHERSPRHRGPFVTVPCPALPQELIESELFGHVQGAFTGATRDRKGRVALAEGGSLFLDEVGDLPPPLQPKLLRFLQDREYERVGDPHTRRADVRILAASNRDLEREVAEGTFREDLYYRLKVIEICLLPLAERAEDLPALAKHLLETLSRQHGRPGLTLSPAAGRALLAHPWPGNIRELRNALERGVMLAESETIQPKDLGLGSEPVSAMPGAPVTLAQVEEAHIRRILALTDSFREAAETLGIDEATLWRRRKRYGLLADEEPGPREEPIRDQETERTGSP